MNSESFEECSQESCILCRKLKSIAHLLHGVQLKTEHLVNTLDR